MTNFRSLIKDIFKLVEKLNYDEIKYLSGKDAIDFLQNLTDGTYSAFKKDEENK